MTAEAEVVNEPVEGEVENKETLEGETEVVEVAEVEVESLEEAKAKLAELNKAAKERDDYLKQIRKYEKEAKARAEKEAKAKEDFKTLYESEHAERVKLEETIVAQTVDSIVADTLQKHNVLNRDAAMRLLDKSKIKVEDGVVDSTSVKLQVAEIKKIAPQLFGKVEAPETKRTGDSNPNTTFKVTPSTTRKELDAQWEAYYKSKGRSI